MTQAIAPLTAAEFSALCAVDGRRQPKMPAQIMDRLLDLGLIERRKWPTGPFRRTARGERRVREGK